MKLIICRHSESNKNVNKRFSSVGNQENLTQLGIDQTDHLAQCISDYIQLNKLSPPSIYVADSIRAIETAQMVADKVQIRNILPIKEFLSVTTDASISGKSENEILSINPQFISELSLYRSGLFNGYCYSTVADSIKSGKYEKQIIESFLAKVENQDVSILVMHHSSLTALMIYFARIGHGYPKDFYGLVRSDLGKIYFVDYDINNCKILFANEDPEKLRNWRN